MQSEEGAAQQARRAGGDIPTQARNSEEVLLPQSEGSVAQSSRATVPRRKLRVLRGLWAQPAAKFACSRLQLPTHDGKQRSRVRQGASEITSGPSSSSSQGRNSRSGSTTGASNGGEDFVPTWVHLASMGLEWGGVANMRAASSALYRKALAIVGRKTWRRNRLGSGTAESVRNADGATCSPLPCSL